MMREKDESPYFLVVSFPTRNSGQFAMTTEDEGRRVFTVFPPNFRERKLTKEERRILVVEFPTRDVDEA